MRTKLSGPQPRRLGVATANRCNYGRAPRSHRLSKLLAVSHRKGRSETPSDLFHRLVERFQIVAEYHSDDAAIQTIFMSGTILIENSELQHDSFQHPPTAFGCPIVNDLRSKKKVFPLLIMTDAHCPKKLWRRAGLQFIGPIIQYITDDAIELSRERIYLLSIFGSVAGLILVLMAIDQTADLEQWLPTSSQLRTTVSHFMADSITPRTCAPGSTSK